MVQTNEPEQASRLSSRIEEYRREAQLLVAKGSEHSCWEFKRAWSICQDHTGERLEFAKLIQGLANCHHDRERFLVIGADQRERAFLAVGNAEEFDPAKVSDLLARYLDPMPSFEAFNGLETDDGKRLVIIALARTQPRPIVVKKEGHDPTAKVHLRQGDVWIKRDTKLELAQRSDLDRMYEEQVEAKAEARAHRRFAHLREEIVDVPQTAVRSAGIPTIDLILGTREAFRAYFLSLLAEKDAVRLNILFELFRELMISGWQSTKQTGVLSEYMSDRFTPALERSVEAALLIIKHNLHAERLVEAASLLQETYDFFRTSHFPQLPENLGGVPIWEPALHVYAGLRALCIYAVARDRCSYLPSIHRRFVKRFSSGIHADTEVPLLFWPFSNSFRVPMPDGLIPLLWTKCIDHPWGTYFGGVDDFEQAACSYEVVLELNSWVGVGIASEAATKTFREQRPRAAMSYGPQFWRYSPRYLTPMTERILVSLQSGTDLVENLALVPDSLKVCFSGDRRARTLMLGRFAAQLEKTHSEIAWSQNRFPGIFDWEGPVADAVNLAASEDSKRAANAG
jgi:hypothetical protein